MEKDKIRSLDEICQNSNNLENATMKIVCFQTSNGLIIQSSDYLDGTCVSRFNLKIHLDFSYEAFHCGIKCTINWSTIQEAIRYLNAMEIDNKKDVLRQQMNSMKACVGEKKYELNTIIRTFEYFATSRATYKILRNDYELPSVQTLTRLTSKVKNVNDDIFLENVFSNLNMKEKTCILLVDEVYVNRCYNTMVILSLEKQ